MRSLLLVVCLAASAGACGSARMSAVDCAKDAPVPGVARACRVPGFADRDVIVRLPKKARLDAPLVLGFHGGGAHKETLPATTCQDGDDGGSGCLYAAADHRGVVLALPDGQASEGDRRAWNDGKRATGMRCNPSCAAEVDDVAYVRAVLDLLTAVAPHDPRRVYALGLSNGGGMAHRLACELDDRLVAIAAIAGTNRFAAVSACEPKRPVAILQIHGLEDPIWPYRGGQSSVSGGAYPSVGAAITGANATLPDLPNDLGWVLRNGCGDVNERKIPDRVSDGTTSIEQSWSGCRDGTEVRLVTIRGGGHTWPGGHQYLGERLIGRVARDFEASSYVLEWLLRFRRQD